MQSGRIARKNVGRNFDLFDLRSLIIPVIVHERILLEHRGSVFHLIPTYHKVSRCLNKSRLCIYLTAHTVPHSKTQCLARHLDKFALYTDRYSPLKERYKLDEEAVR